MGQTHPPSSRTGRRREFPYVNFPFPLPHGVAVMPRLHAQQGILADARGKAKNVTLFYPYNQNGKSSVSDIPDLVEVTVSFLIEAPTDLRFPR
jgi:hypothetical protein